MSSQYDLYDLGNTCVTMVTTKRCNKVTWSETVKSYLSPDYSLQWEYEAGIASNRGSERHGEMSNGSCTHRPSRHGSCLWIKYFMALITVLNCCFLVNKI